MASWKKVIVSGSDASLGSLTTTGNIIATGSLAANSTVKFPGLTNATQASIVGIDVATGQLYYQGTGSFTANSASYALSASNAVSSSYAINSSQAETASFVTLAQTASFTNLAQTASIALSISSSISSQNLQHNVLFVDTTGPGLVQVDGGLRYNPNTNLLTTTASLASLAEVASLAQTASFVLNAVSASFAGSGNGTFSGSFSGSFAGDGGGLTNVPASGIVGLNLSQIASGSVTASIAPDLGFRVNTNSQITGSLIVSSNINSAGNVVATGANSSLTGSFTGSFAGNFVGTSNLPDLTQGTGISAFTYDGSTTANVSVSGAAALTSGSLTKWSGNAFRNSSISDLANVTINSPGGVYVQGGGIDVSGSSTFHDNVVMQGNLTVQGTASFQNVTNLAIKDQFILLNSGSTTFQDSGIVINTGNAANSGSAFFLETSGTTTGTNGLYGRFAVAVNVLPDATSATAAEYANTTTIVGSAPGNAVPQFGGTGLGQGNMWVDTSNGDIYIYA